MSHVTFQAQGNSEIWSHKTVLTGGRLI